MLLVARRRRARARQPREPAAAREPPETRASAALARAREALAADPRAAADAASTALRRFLLERFGVPAPARTSEELAALAPPFALSTRWPRLVALLRVARRRALRAARAAPDATDRLTPLLEAAEAFVRDSLPPAAAR